MLDFIKQVAWIKSDSKAILAIHNRLVAHNPRLSVTHNGHNTWKLHISNIQKNDSGSYMCQINTDPMRWQVSFNICTLMFKYEYYKWILQCKTFIYYMCTHKLCQSLVKQEENRSYIGSEV